MNEQYYSSREEASNKDFLGIVIDYDDVNKEIILEQRNYFKIGDEMTIFGPNIEDFDLKVEYIKDEKGVNIDDARHPKQIVRIPSETKVYKNDIIRVRF